MKYKLSGAHGGILYAPMPQTPNFTITARVSGPVTEDKLRAALGRLPERHPMLIAHGIIENGSAYFTDEGGQPISLRVVARNSDNDWIEQIKLELERPFQYSVGPVFRCVCVYGNECSELILVCDHITSDGLAGVYALRTLLELLDDPTRPLEVLPPPNFAERLPQSVQDRAAALNAAPPPPPPMPDGPPPSFVPPPLNIIPIELSEADTTALIARCKAEGTSVQAALSAACLWPFVETEPDSPIRKLEVPVNLRNRLSPPIGEAYGVYIALMILEIDCSAGPDLWQLARSVNKTLTEAMTEERYLQNPMLMVIVADHFPAENPFDTDYDISISNLGRLDIPTQYGPFCLEAIFAPTMRVESPEHRILGVNTFNGQLRATFISRRPESAQYIEQAKTLLARMIA